MSDGFISRGVRFAANVVTGQRRLSDVFAVLEYQRSRKKTILNLEVTARCNASCKSCMRDPRVLGIPTNLEMDLSDLNKILDGYSSASLQSVLLGGSESLLHSRFFEIVDEIRRRFPGTPIELYTNGIVLGKRPEVLSALAEANLDAVTFSLHGATERRVAELQPGVSLSSVLSAVDFLSQNCSSTLWVSYVVQDSNVEELADFVELVRGTAFKGISFMPMNDADFTQEPVDYACRWERYHLRQRLEAAREQAERYGLRVTRAIDLCSCGLDMDIFRADGSIQTCPGNSRAETLMGNALKEPIAVVRKAKQKRLRSLTHCLNRGEIPPLCVACAIPQQRELP